MKTVNLTIKNETGMHARPAGIFVKAAQAFQSQVQVNFGGRTVNGKWVMNLMTLGLQQGSEFSLIVDGTDEDAAITSLSNLVNSEFQHGS